MYIIIIGCGQLSRMLALAGIKMGFKFSFIAEHGEDTVCIDGLGNVFLRDQGQTIETLLGDTERPDVITFEREHTDLSMLDNIDDKCQVSPNRESMYACQNRYREKQLLSSLSIPFAPYLYNVSVKDSLATLSLPVVVKACSEGYDGKNQWKLNSDLDVDNFDKNNSLDDFIVEQWMPFEKEVSLIAVRTAEGGVSYYPLTENVHKNGILKRSIAPIEPCDNQLEQQAQKYISSLMNELSYVGVMAMECFIVNGQIFVNELAPRVHNSGHWTQMGSTSCQFENHLRAIASVPLGSTEIRPGGVAGMVNLIGNEKPSLSILSNNSTLHWYNKTVRPKRKLGHINFVEKDRDALLSLMEKVAQHSLDNATDL